MINPGLLWRTIRHLTLRQVAFQVLNRLRSPAKLRFPATPPTGYFLLATEPDKPVSFVAGSFTFLNRSTSFPHQIDWNHPNFGKLWTYNLNYFDFLNQPDMSVETGLALIYDFIAQTDGLNDALEPYPTSLRIINWVWFLSRNQIQDGPIHRHLLAQADLLNQRLEYHLSGNHLLENGFALLTSAFYFRQGEWFRRASTLVRNELTTQILTDGGHYERSPVYHQLLLDHLLNLLLVVRSDSWRQDHALALFMTEKARQMLGWLDKFTFQNGDVPMVNDAAFGVAPTTRQLSEKARQTLNHSFFGQESTLTEVPDSGYRMFRMGRFELFADVGPIGPKHQPGHAHADTFSFVLYADGQPVLVDPGTSTYEPGNRRAWERSTAAHNTVEFAGQNSSEVWAGFRVGRRAGATIDEDTATRLTARHDGYRNIGIIHQRTWQLEAETLTVTDWLIAAGKPDKRRIPGIARLFFHSGIGVALTETGAIAGPLRVTFEGDEPPGVTLSTYDLADGFNKYQPAQCLTIKFLSRLTTMLTPTV